MTETSMTSQMAGFEAELHSLREKSHSDDEMIALLKRQYEILAMENSAMAQRHSEEMRVLKQRCDEAVRNEKEVTGILNAAAKGIVEGLRRRAGDQIPPVATHAPQEAKTTPRAPDRVQDVIETSVVPNLRLELQKGGAQDTKETPIDEADSANLRDILHRLPVNEFPRVGFKPRVG